MTTLTINTVCKEHTPHLSAISSINDEQYTFCEVCENNIDRFWLEFDGDRLDMWSEWRVTK
jgi:RNA polymerase-binding transcription factor DksA